MSEQQGFSAEQASQAAGEQLAQAAAATPAADAGPTVEQIQSEHRGALLPAEQQISDMMAQFQAQQDAMAAQIAKLQSQLADAKNAAGPPAVEQYANGVAVLVKAHADANPDLPRDVFAPALAAADQLKSAATDAVTSRDPSELTRIAGQVEQWATRFRGKHIDFSSLRADLELLGEAAIRLAA